MFVWWFLGFFPCQSQLEPGFAWVCCVLLLLQGHCRNKGKVWESQIQLFSNEVCCPGDFVLLIPQPELLHTGLGKVPNGPLRWWKYKSQWCCWRRKGKVRIPWENALKNKVIPAPSALSCRHHPMGINQRIFMSKGAFLPFSTQYPLKHCPGTWREPDWRLQVRNKF